MSAAVQARPARSGLNVSPIHVFLILLAAIAIAAIVASGSGQQGPSSTGAASDAQAIATSRAAAAVASTPTNTGSSLPPDSTPPPKNAPSSAQAAQQATAAAGTTNPNPIEAYKTRAPAGQYEAAGKTIDVGCNQLDYLQTIGSYKAGPQSKFVVMVAMVEPLLAPTYVAPLDFSLEGIDGTQVPISSILFTFPTPFPSLMMQAKDRASGALAFSVPRDFVPSKLVFTDPAETVKVTIVAP
jgi:hypothetical protein